MYASQSLDNEADERKGGGGGGGEKQVGNKDQFGALVVWVEEEEKVLQAFLLQDSKIMQNNTDVVLMAAELEHQ